MRFPKTTVEACLVLSIYELKRRGCLDHLRGMPVELEWKNYFETTKGRAKLVVDDECRSVHLTHSFIESRRLRSLDDNWYYVSLTRRECRFGGFRYHLVCPLWKNGVHCGQVVDKLYCPPGAEHFGCRKCYGLSYDSRQVHRGGSQWTIMKLLELTAPPMLRDSEPHSKKIDRVGRQLRSFSSRNRAAAARGSTVGQE